MKRISLFLLTNIAVIALVSLVLSVFNVAPYLSSSGLNYTSLLIFSALFGFSGAFVSLFLSKWMAKRAFSIQMIDQPKTEEEQFLFSTVSRLAQQSSLRVPEIGIYNSPEANAFATGWNKNKALVAVSSGLLSTLSHDEVEGVLGHEISHIANGDMVTLTLIQGVVNTFVIFFARIAAYGVQTFLSRDEEGEGMSSIAYYITAMVFEVLFGIFASIIVMSFSRHREFRADAGSAHLLGKERMIKALEKLDLLKDSVKGETRGKAFAAMKISDKPSPFFALFSSHPPLKKRIEVLRSGKN